MNITVKTATGDVIGQVNASRIHTEAQLKSATDFIEEFDYLVYYGKKNTSGGSFSQVMGIVASRPTGNITVKPVNIRYFDNIFACIDIAVCVEDDESQYISVNPGVIDRFTKLPPPVKTFLDPIVNAARPLLEAARENDDLHEIVNGIVNQLSIETFKLSIDESDPHGVILEEVPLKVNVVKVDFEKHIQAIADGKPSSTFTKAQQRDFIEFVKKAVKFYDFCGIVDKSRSEELIKDGDVTKRTNFMIRFDAGSVYGGVNDPAKNKKLANDMATKLNAAFRSSSDEFIKKLTADITNTSFESFVTREDRYDDGNDYYGADLFLHIHY